MSDYQYQATLEGMLDSLRAEGDYDSTGGFSESVAKTREKLEKFQLINPRLYVVNLIASAIGSGCRGLKVYCDSDDFVLSGDKALSRVKIEELEYRLSAGVSDESEREFAVALQGIKALKPWKFRIEIEGQRLNRVADGWESESVETEGFRIDVRERPSMATAAKFLSAATGAVVADSEQDLIVRHCNLAPVPIELNGAPLNRRLYKLQGVSPSVLQKGPGEVPLPLKGWFESGLETQESDYHAALFHSKFLGPYLVVVVRGVSYRIPCEKVQGVQGVIYADHLSKDLSHVQLVEDGRFQKMIRQLLRVAPDQAS
jgi:hypothetical protein